MIEGYNVEVRLLAMTGLDHPLGRGPSNDAQSEELIEFAGRLCWDTVDRIGTNPNRIQEWIGAGHESVVEHSSATFFVKGSRVLTHELVRHRIASYSQRSQRYVRETSAKYVIPAEILAGSRKAQDLYRKAMDEAWSAYRELLAIGMKAEVARYVLPNACETQIVVTMNFRELRHFVKLRTSQRALPEIRAVAGEIRRIMKERAPKVFADI